MKHPILDNPIFHNEEAAYSFVESHLWPNGPVCPHCGTKGKTGKLKGKSYRPGLHKCYACRKPFTVKIGTIFEDSHIPLRLWLQAIFALSSSKKGISSNQLHRTLGVTLKTAWFMSHRIREAMRQDSLTPFGSNGGIVEVDETFQGNEPDKPKCKGYAHKNKVLSLVDRELRDSRSMVIKDTSAKTIVPILKENIAREAEIMTDDAGQYRFLKDKFADHNVVCHSRKEYVSPLNPLIHIAAGEEAPRNGRLENGHEADLVAVLPQFVGEPFWSSEVGFGCSNDSSATP